MAKKTLDNINKVAQAPKENKAKSRTNQTTNFLSGFKPKPRFKATPVEDSDPASSSFKRIDLIQLSITIVLAIIALWSAYFVTHLLSTDSNPLASINKTVDQIKNKVSNQDKTTKPKEGNPTSNNSAALNSQDKTDNSKNPFAPTVTTTNQSNTPTKDTSVSATPPTIAKDSFSLRILNGNGVTGDASKFKKILTNQGFKVGTIGNARLKYSKTQIYYIAGQERQANLVKASLSNRQVELSQQNQDLVGQGYQVLVVLGRS